MGPSSCGRSSPVRARTEVVVADVTMGERVGRFVILRDEDGLRHAVTLAAIVTVSDADDSGTVATIQLTGDRVAVIRRPLDEVLSWFA